jgi:aminoglycoside phosphotransferase (APT) family kinase protein
MSAEQLGRVVALAVPGASGVTGLRAMSGGASQETWAFDVVGADGADGAIPLVPLVLRRASPGAEQRGAANAGLENEAALLRLAAPEGIPVPEVLHVLRPEDGLGQGFIMRHIEGETIARKILREARFDAVRPTLARACGRYMARIHRIQTDRLPPLRQETPAQAVAHYLAEHRRFGARRPVFELAFRWVQDHAPAGPALPSLVHGDFRNGNLIVGPEGIRAVLDWELAHLGDPMEDLGWICVNSWRFGNIDLPVGGFGPREELFAGYEEEGGSVDRERVRFWEVFGTLKWGVMCENMVSTFLTGDDPSVERAAIGRRVSETDLDLLRLLAPRELHRTLASPASASSQGVKND